MKDENFFEHVWEVTRQIPKGRVTSYGAIAKVLGVGNLSRMVGHAMGECGKANPPVPYYRVVNSSGHLTGDPSSADKRQQLLEEEGIEVKNLKVQNFKKVFWDPVKELNYE
ncbi:MGMT family protein [Mucilaginibacter sp. KACC 22063]|uniref:MGMT family protein n=1 Tax=Mucilaginibacter sp. KACC 22063 TaxID=3025666 RepID=UPI002366D89E|nr:MGMT family protein [Mucilaginibacter sp. KACC 22063]WDF55999.1 MGMT family protein [Mucilaginibacter sp. KACC 22063]